MTPFPQLRRIDAILSELQSLTDLTEELSKIARHNKQDLFEKLHEVESHINNLSFLVRAIRRRYP